MSLWRPIDGQTADGEVSITNFPYLSKAMWLYQGDQIQWTECLYLVVELHRAIIYHMVLDSFMGLLWVGGRSCCLPSPSTVAGLTPGNRT